MIAALLWALALLSVAYWIFAWWCVRSFFRIERCRCSTFRPMVSILKPLKGIDAGAYDNFASFCRQDYPSYELLFGVADHDDPVIVLVNRLQKDFPHVRICLIHVHHPAMNPKIAILERLTREAHGSVLVVTDSDVRVTPEYLARVVSPLADPDAGVVTCPYFSRHSGTLPSRLQTLYLNACFLPSVILAMWALGVHAGLGATIAVRHRDLMRAGGYAGIADYLTDDYQVAVRVAALGLRVELSDYVVENLQGAATFREAWEREVRWSSGIRVNGPIRHLGIGVTFTLPLALGAAAASGFSNTSLAMLAAILLTRTLLAWRMLSMLDARQWHPEIAWLPIRECLSMLVWAAAIMGRRIRWRGREFELLRNGRLEAI